MLNHPSLIIGASAVDPNTVTQSKAHNLTVPSVHGHTLCVGVWPSTPLERVSSRTSITRTLSSSPTSYTLSHTHVNGISSDAQRHPSTRHQNIGTTSSLRGLMPNPKDNSHLILFPNIRLSSLSLFLSLLLVSEVTYNHSSNGILHGRRSNKNAWNGEFHE